MSKITLLKFYKSWNVLQASKYFLWFLQVSCIARGSKIPFLEFDKFWNVLQTSKYFSMIFKSLLECHKVKKLYWRKTTLVLSCKFQNIFIWFKNNIISVWKVLKYPAGFNFFMIFKNLLDYQKVLNTFSGVWKVLTSPGMSCKLKNIFLWLLKVSWIARRSKITFLKFEKSWNVLKASNYFFMIFKSFLDCQKVQDNFPEV